jgi:hypothetical protein
VLQVLLSQVHRLRALVLLGRFLDMGLWAVDLALSVGIFPYVLKLLQVSAPWRVRGAAAAPPCQGPWCTARSTMYRSEAIAHYLRWF